MPIGEGIGGHMRYLLILLVMGCASNKGRMPASEDPTQDMIKYLTREEPEDRTQLRCEGDPPGSDDRWCSWVCIDGRWSRMCR
jgi:hypothetical protein